MLEMRSMLTRTGIVIGQGHERTFWDDANILYFSESMSFAGIFIYQDIKCKICLFYYM